MARLPSLPPKVFGPSSTKSSPITSAQSHAATPIAAPHSTSAHHPSNVPEVPPQADTAKNLPASSSSPRKRRPASAPRQSSPKKSSPSFSTTKIRNDRLGTLVRQLCEAYAKAPSWESFVTEFRGPSYLSSELDNIDHPAAALLRLWRDHGVPADSDSPPWTQEQKDE